MIFLKLISCRGAGMCCCENIFKLVYNNAILNLNERKQC